MKISANTRLFCLLGDPVSHSRSPTMMNSAFESMGMDAVYLAFRVPINYLGDVISGLKGIGVGGISGINITAPLKESVIDFMDVLSPEAEEAGAVNTIVLEENSLIGHNTDGVGLLNALTDETGKTLKGSKILILGAGGAVRGILPALIKGGAGKIGIANRTREKAERLIERLGHHGSLEVFNMEPDGLNEMLADFDVVINGTSIATVGVDFLGLDLTLMEKGSIFFDTNYNKGEGNTREYLEENGIRFSDGLTMLLYQGASAFELWTKMDAPISSMKSALGHGV